ncbi:alpha/beta fold hydrolase, partial [Roseibium sp. TrichSKD4]|uniref:alpha/beta fold hydrolase n=1 Tax=Roseibium sp. TrichSKD4 TaxID=744980 RepID=UPI003528B6CC
HLIYWLKNNGYEKISVLGFSLGSWVAGLVAAHDLSVSKASLFLTAGSLADMVWTGRATGSIRKSLEPHISLPALRRAWAPLDLGNYVKELERPELSVHLVIAKRDKVVLPSLSCQLVQNLQEAGSKPSVMELNCGHYSISMLPYILRSGYSLRAFLLR